MNRYTQQKMKFIYTYHVYRTQHHTFTPITSIIIPQVRMFVWSSEVNYINSTPFFRLKIVSTNVKTYKCTATLFYIVFKKGDIIMTLGNDNAGNWSKCVMLIIIAIRNVCRIIIWKDLNWKMCKKDPYNCGKGPVYTVFDLKITVFLLTVMYKVILQLLWNICISVSIKFHLVKWSLLIKVSYAKLSLILKRLISFWEFFKIIDFLAFFIIFNNLKRSQLENVQKGPI
jgi:hypothetical protein